MMKLNVCDICDFQTGEKQHLSSHKQDDHLRESDTEENDDDICLTCHSDLISYNAMCPGNVAFHYREVHSIKINWEQADSQCKR